MSCTSKVKQQELLQNSTANPMGRKHQDLHWDMERFAEEGPGHQEGCSSSFQLSAVTHRLWCYTDSPPTHRSGFGPVMFHTPVATHFHAIFMSGTSPLRCEASFCSTAWPLPSQPLGLFLSRS